MPVLEQVYFDNSVQTWLVALGVAVGAVIVLRVALSLVTHRLRKFAQHTETAWDDIAVHAISRTKRLFLLIVAVQAGSNVLSLPDRTRDLINVATVLAILLQAGIWATAALRFGLAHQKEALMQEDRAAATSMSAVRFLGQVLIWSVVLLLSLDNLGIDVTALIAGLGVGGVAVALAVQNILGDLFASLAIVFDKPFVLGDFVTVGSQAGTVEAIGLKTTRIRSLGGEQLVFANADLLGSRLHNFGRMEERRVVFTLGVTYQTTSGQLEEIPRVIRRIVEQQEGARFDRAHFFEYGDFSLNFEVVFYVNSPDYTTYMDIRQAINLAVFGAFQERGIEFAYPTQTLFVERAAA
ncbi:MAG: mechanosensitive ion channel family protein [Gemmatimonadales bacterium]